MKGGEEAGKLELMKQIEDLFEEAKVRMVWWAIVIFGITYFMSHTSSSMWKNFPVGIVLVSTLWILTTKVEFRRKSSSFCHQPTYNLSNLEKKQLSVNDTRLSCTPPLPKWKRKIDSPLVEAAIDEFIEKVLKEFVVDLWYTVITPDMESPELIRCVIMDAIGEIALRVKQINLVELLTKDVLDLVGEHIDMFRRNQTAIGVDVMKTLSSDERDERLKNHLTVSGDLHPALLSNETEYKVLQKLVSGILARVLRPREAQCPLVRCFAREIITCLILRPIMDFANPGYINEVIVHVLLTIKEIASNQSGDDTGSSLGKAYSLNSQVTEKKLESKNDDQRESDSKCNDNGDQGMVHQQPAVWARMLEAVTHRRTEVLAPENLENMWTKGTNYKMKENKLVEKMDAGADLTTTGTIGRVLSSQKLEKSSSFKGSHLIVKLDHSLKCDDIGNKSRLKRRSNSTSDLTNELDKGIVLTQNVKGLGWSTELYKDESGSNKALQNERRFAPGLMSRVIGAYFDKVGSKSFAVYSIAVTDMENRTWFVNRRYSNFERLHRQLKEIPSYTLHLPPKRIFSSSTEDSFVHQRCIQLDKYLQDMLSNPNVADQLEVWDFLSASSKNYSFGNCSSVIRTLAVNVDGAVDDIVHQFKGVSDGLMRKVMGSCAPTSEVSSPVVVRTLSNYNTDEKNKDTETSNNTSDNEEGNQCGSSRFDDSKPETDEHVLHSDDESSLIKAKQRLDGSSGSTSQAELSGAKLLETSHPLDDPAWIPPEWTPPKVSVPLLNLVDKVFQLKRRGWLRRHVFWLSKQIVQLVMEDSIDDFLLRHIYWLRKEDTVAKGIQWAKEILWPGGTFFVNIGGIPTRPSDPQHHQAKSDNGGSKSHQPESFEQQLEAARRASDIKKMLFDGAPSALVGLVGAKQYRRCARDIYYFTQSSICVKQLTFSMVELVLVSIFPEMRDLIIDLHEKSHFKAG